MQIRHKIWVEDEKGKQILGEGLVRILEMIEKHGSMVGAAKELKMSYRACWGKVKEMERRFGKSLIEPHVGGGKNRGTLLTTEARKLLRQFHLFQEEVAEKTESLFRMYFPD